MSDLSALSRPNTIVYPTSPLPPACGKAQEETAHPYWGQDMAAFATQNPTTKNYFSSTEKMGTDGISSKDDCSGEITRITCGLFDPEKERTLKGYLEEAKAALANAITQIGEPEWNRRFHLLFVEGQPKPFIPANLCKYETKLVNILTAIEYAIDAQQFIFEVNYKQENENTYAYIWRTFSQEEHAPISESSMQPMLRYLDRRWFSNSDLTPSSEEHEYSFMQKRKIFIEPAFFAFPTSSGTITILHELSHIFCNARDGEKHINKHDCCYGLKGVEYQKKKGIEHAINNADNIAYFIWLFSEKASDDPDVLKLLTPTTPETISE